MCLGLPLSSQAPAASRCSFNRKLILVALSGTPTKYSLPSFGHFPWKVHAADKTFQRKMAKTWQAILGGCATQCYMINFLLEGQWV